jgi:hypothetical protein
VPSFASPKSHFEQNDFCGNERTVATQKEVGATRSWATAYAPPVLEDGVPDGSVHILPALIYVSPPRGSAHMLPHHLAPPPPRTEAPWLPRGLAVRPLGQGRA